MPILLSKTYIENLALKYEMKYLGIFLINIFLSRFKLLTYYYKCLNCG